MRWGTWTSLSAAVLVAITGCSVNTEDIQDNYSSCEQVRSDFPSGVAVEEADVSELRVKPITNSTGYLRASMLDEDSDGIACEFENPLRAEGQSSPGDPVNNSTFFFFRIENGTLERRGNFGDWHSNDFDTSAIPEIRIAAFNNLRSLEAGEAPAVNWLISENVPSAMREAYEYQANQTLVRLPFTQGSLPIDLLIYTEMDFDFASQYWSKFYHAAETLSRRENDLAPFTEDGGEAWSVGGASEVRQPLDQSTPIIGVDFYMSSAHAPESNLLPDHVSHELFHVWQYQAVELDKKIAAQERYDIADYVPCHAMEGAATTIGTALLMPHVGWYSDNADVIVRRIANQSGITTLSASDARDLLQKGESWESCNEAYAIGMLAHEWLIGKFGVERFLEIYRLAGQRAPYSESIQALYGMSLEEFYVEVSEYISQEFNRALQKNY